MRWAFGFVLVALGCDSFAGPAPPLRDAPSTQPGVGGPKQGPTRGGGGTTFSSPPVLIVDDPVAEPEPDPDWCTVAKQQGATFCEANNNTVPHLEFCEPAPAAPRSEGGAAGMAGADGGAAGADAGAGGVDAGAAGAQGVPAQPTQCVPYDGPPEWVYDLLIQCIAHCGVGIRSSERKLEGSCCYVAESEYYGR